MSAHWRNILSEDGSPDNEMVRIDEIIEDFGGVSDAARHVRALISRFDSVTHYHAFDNLKLLLGAIGSLDYPGRPAVNVLDRAWEIDIDRRGRFVSYVRALEAWAADEDAPSGVGGEARQVFATLQENDSERRWLAASLAKTLKTFTYRPEDDITELDDAAYIVAVYRSVLDRDPSPDDLATRISELQGGKTRPSFMREILGADESVQRHLHSLTHHVNENTQ
jgi:hypothetical protein